MITTAAEVLALLNTPHIEFNTQEVRAIYDAYKFRSDRLSRIAVMTFGIGDKVSFDIKRSPKTGTIIRINTKSVSVRVIEKVRGLDSDLMIDSPIVWKVSPSFLKKAD